MNPEQVKSIALKWFEAFNLHDIEMLLALYDEEAEHFSPKLKIRQPGTNGYIRGKKALREWWEDAFNRLPSLNYKLQRLIADESSVFMEYSRHVKNEADLQVGEVLEIKNNLIIRSRVYHG